MFRIKRTALLFLIITGFVFFMYSCNNEAPVIGSGTNSSETKDLIDDYICVYVTCCDGGILSGANVRISHNGGLTFEGKTNSNGVVCFWAEDIADGWYDIYVEGNCGTATSSFYFSHDMAQPVNVHICLE